MIWNVNVAAPGRFIDLFYLVLKKKVNKSYLSVEEDSKKRRRSAFI